MSLTNEPVDNEEEKGAPARENASPNDDFGFYFQYTKPLVLDLSSAEDRAIAAAWVQKLEAEPQSDEEKKLRLDYLKLLLFVLQKGRLSGIFKKQPNPGPLQPFPQGFTLTDMGNLMIDEDELQSCGAGDARCVPYTIELSNDLREFIAAQEIPNFGVQMYYAWSSEEPVHKWSLFDEDKFPQFILEKIKQIKEIQTDEKGNTVTKSCNTRRKLCDIPLIEKLSKKKVKSPQEIEKAIGRSYHTYLGLTGRLGNFKDKCDGEQDQDQKQKFQKKPTSPKCTPGQNEDYQLEEMDDFFNGLSGERPQQPQRACQCPYPYHNPDCEMNRGSPQPYEEQQPCRTVTKPKMDAETSQFTHSVQKSKNVSRRLVYPPEIECEPPSEDQIARTVAKSKMDADASQYTHPVQKSKNVSRRLVYPPEIECEPPTEDQIGRTTTKLDPAQYTHSAQKSKNVSRRLVYPPEIDANAGGTLAPCPERRSPSPGYRSSSRSRSNGFSSQESGVRSVNQSHICVCPSPPCDCPCPRVPQQQTQHAAPVFPSLPGRETESGVLRQFKMNASMQRPQEATGRKEVGVAGPNTYSSPEVVHCYDPMYQDPNQPEQIVNQQQFQSSRQQQQVPMQCPENYYPEAEEMCPPEDRQMQRKAQINKPYEKGQRVDDIEKRDNRCLHHSGVASRQKVSTVKESAGPTATQAVHKGKFRGKLLKKDYCLEGEPEIWAPPNTPVPGPSGLRGLRGSGLTKWKAVENLTATSLSSDPEYIESIDQPRVSPEQCIPVSEGDNDGQRVFKKASAQNIHRIKNPNYVPGPLAPSGGEGRLCNMSDILKNIKQRTEAHREKCAPSASQRAVTSNNICQPPQPQPQTQSPYQFSSYSGTPPQHTIQCATTPPTGPPQQPEVMAACYGSTQGNMNSGTVTKHPCTQVSQQRGVENEYQSPQAQGVSAKSQAWSRTGDNTSPVFQTLHPVPYDEAAGEYVSSESAEECPVESSSNEFEEEQRQECPPHQQPYSSQPPPAQFQPQTPPRQYQGSGSVQYVTMVPRAHPQEKPPVQYAQTQARVQTPQQRPTHVQYEQQNQQQQCYQTPRIYNQQVKRGQIVSSTPVLAETEYGFEQTYLTSTIHPYNEEECEDNDPTVYIPPTQPGNAECYVPAGEYQARNNDPCVPQEQYSRNSQRRRKKRINCPE